MEGSIPAHAKIVFEGIHTRVYQWEQELFDGTTKTFERVVRMPSVIIFAIDGNKILFQDELQPGWEKECLSLPAGRLDSFDEDSLAAAKRELQEESGYESDDWEKLWQLSYASVVEQTIYVARAIKKTSDPHLDPGEKISSRFVTLDEFFELLEDPRFRLWSIKANLLAIKYHPERRKEFEETLFGK